MSTRQDEPTDALLEIADLRAEAVNSGRQAAAREALIGKMRRERDELEAQNEALKSEVAKLEERVTFAEAQAEVTALTRALSEVERVTNWWLIATTSRNKALDRAEKAEAERDAEVSRSTRELSALTAATSANFTAMRDTRYYWEKRAIAAEAEALDATRRAKETVDNLSASYDRDIAALKQQLTEARMERTKGPALRKTTPPQRCPAVSPSGYPCTRQADHSTPHHATPDPHNVIRWRGLAHA